MLNTLKKTFFDSDKEVIEYCLAAAMRFKGISSDASKKDAFCDNIESDNYKKIPFRNSKEKYKYFLKLKYLYYLSTKKGIAVEDLFEQYEVPPSLQTKYAEIFDYWSSDYIAQEETILLLRYNQFGKKALEFWYNDLPEFNEWLEFLLASSATNMELNSSYMGKHDSDSFSVIDYSKLNELIVKCSNKFVNLFSSGNRDENMFIHLFICLISEIFEAELVDHMTVNFDSDGVPKIEYNIVSDEKIRKAKEKELKREESYAVGQGITGSVLICDKKDKNPHTGTNHLEKDVRQSVAHKKKHSALYGITIDNFWVFPYFDGNDKVKGAFRVINKKTNATEKHWTYEERATLLLSVRWFELFWSETLKTMHSVDNEFAFDDKENEKIYQQLEIPWFDKKFFDLLFMHLKNIVHQKIENHYMGVCVAVYEKNIVSVCSESNQYPEYQIKPLFYDEEPPRVFNGSEKIDSKLLADVSLLYKTMHPFTAFCLFTSDGCFYGIRQFFLQDGENPNLDKIKTMTKEGEESIVFLTQGEEKTIRVYKNHSFFADYYLSESDGKWRFRKFSQVKLALLESNINANVAHLICELIFELSFRQVGSLLVFSNGGFDFIDEKAKLKKLEKGHIQNVHLSVLRGWASMDGAMLCGLDGRVQYVGVILPKNSEETKLTPFMENLITTHQKGSRHTTAAYYSKNHPNDCVVVISQNKGISILHDGKDLIWDDKPKNEHS